MNSFILVAAVAFGGVACAATAQDREPAQRSAQVVVYDVRDLAGPNVDQRRERIDRIVDLIQDNVDPDGWRDLGGETGSIQEIQGNLIITNTARNHREIEQLLAKLRTLDLIHMQVDATLIASPMPVDQLDLGLPALERAVGGGGLAVVNAGAASRAMEKLIGARGTNVLTSPRITVRNRSGATLTIEGGEFVTLPILGEGGATAPARMLNGATVQLEPKLEPGMDEFAVMLNVRMSGISRDGDRIIQRIAERSLNVNMSDGEVAFIELPVTLHRLVGLPRITDPMTDTQTLEVIREPMGEADGETVLLMIRPSLIVPEDEQD